MRDIWKGIHKGALFIYIEKWTGSSMNPTIVQGDQVVFLSKWLLPPTVGDIILFKVGGSIGRQLIGHRIVREDLIGGQRAYITKGDNHEEIDGGYRTDMTLLASSF